MKRVFSIDIKMAPNRGIQSLHYTSDHKHFITFVSVAIIMDFDRYD